MNRLDCGGNKKGEGCIYLHLFTTGNITRHSFTAMEAAFTIEW